jgi:hypothetical protein
VGLVTHVTIPQGGAQEQMCEQVRQGMKLWDDGFALDHLLDAAAVQSLLQVCLVTGSPKNEVTSQQGCSRVRFPGAGWSAAGDASCWTALHTSAR